MRRPICRIVTFVYANITAYIVATPITNPENSHLSAVRYCWLIFFAVWCATNRRTYILIQTLPSGKLERARQQPILASEARKKEVVIADEASCEAEFCDLS